MTINLTLPWPPSVNSYWRTVKGRTLLSRKGREYKKDVCTMVQESRSNRHLGGRLAVKVLLNPPSKARRDVDNSIKAVLDAMQAAGVYLDDSQVDRLLVERGTVQRPGSAVVEVSEI